MVLNTLLYENNYKKILNEQSWFFNYQSDIITKKLITVNNVSGRDFMESELDSWKEKYNFEYFFVEDYEKQAIDFFNLDIDKKTTIGYYYIIPYFSLTLFLNEGFVFHVSEDCTQKLYFDDTFLIESKKEILNNDKIPATTLSWGYPKQSFGKDVGEWEQEEAFIAKNKVEPNLDNFWMSIGFSDQLFVASVDKLKKIDYNLENYDGPGCCGAPYCPNSWERRLSDYLYNNDQYRGVWKNNQHYYIHATH
jgi:hypothetical protein